ncbi:MAG: M20 family metallopeptidase [Candidatus Aminicenantes bacterium]|nr:M20 family metallopeptidase [Candidatus Aminicenantes bacterium]
MNFYHYYKSRKGEMINLLKEIVYLESPSTDKKAVNACSAFVMEEFKKAGARISQFPQKKIGTLYVAEYPSSVPKSVSEQILLLLHVDTVWPVGKIHKMPFYVSEDKVFGPGVLDMKASIVMTLSSIKALSELNTLPKKKIAVFLNSAEEIGSEAAYEVIKSLCKKSDYVLCLEPSLPGGGLKMQRKGRLVIRLESKGKAAHAGTPDKGVNAIEELMHQLRRVKELEKEETTVNIGLIEGGEKPNIVAKEARAVLDVRFWKNENKEKFTASLKKMKPVLKGAQVRFTTESLTPPMEKSEASSELFSKVKKIASSLDMRLTAGKTGGGSDASVASSMGIPTLDGLGPDGKGIHAENEHLILPSLIERTALLTEILIQL